MLLFIVSAPAWWLFELFNSITRNWFYDGRQYFTDMEYALLATLSFSTVIPAVFGTTELISTLNLFKGFRDGRKLDKTSRISLTMLILGLTMLILLVLFPKYCYPFIWGSVYLIIEPVNIKLKNRTLLDFTKTGNWQPIFNLFTGSLICGFFWELWNYYSYPKWIYDAPFVNFAHIFEMPLIGFIGYLPFSLELYALYNLAFRKLRIHTTQN